MTEQTPAPTDRVSAPTPVLDGNPLFELWSSLDHDYRATGVDYFEQRRFACRTYAWAVPDPASIDRLVEFTGTAPIHEVGAGSGYWAAMLSAAGARVVATDATPPTDNHYLDERISLYHPVGLADATVAAEAAGAAGATLLLVWPPYDHPMATDAALAFVAAGGRRLAYVGERFGGCTADDDFFAMFPGGRGWGVGDDAVLPRATVTHHPVPNWCGIHDELMLVQW